MLHAQYFFKNYARFRLDIALSRLSRYLDIQARRTHLMMENQSMKFEFAASAINSKFIDFTFKDMPLQIQKL